MVIRGKGILNDTNCAWSSRIYYLCPFKQAFCTLYQEKYGANNYAFPPLYKNDSVCFFETESYPMQLMMYIGNDMIESVPLSEERISQPGYLGKFKRMLKDKYADLIREAPTPPEFLVVDIATPSSQSTSAQS